MTTTNTSQAAQGDMSAEQATTQRAGRSRKSSSAFRTISEVAKELGVQQHVLRFWETKFSQVRPLKRGGGRRYYRPEDIQLLQKIHELLYTEGYTIKGVQKLLKQHGKNQVINADFAAKAALEPKASNAEKPQKQLMAATPKGASIEREVLEAMLDELKSLRKAISE